jgi:hypothetical protein
MVMKRTIAGTVMFCAMLLVSAEFVSGGEGKKLQPDFHTSDRCFACHNQLTTATGKDVSIGTHWRSSIMANSARDPYWQASVRRESIDHPSATRDIEDECSVCHMPVARYESKLKGQKGEVFSYLPFEADPDKSAQAEDGVTCSVCHQISKQKLGTKESFSGEFVIEAPVAKDQRPEYGPFVIDAGRQRIMDSSTGGFQPTFAEHIRDSALCGSCHQLYTTARDAEGKAIGYLPEQMPYLEWLHSDYPARQTCQSCHMPEVRDPVQISSVLGETRVGLHQHVFVGGNFLMQSMLNRYSGELNVAALPEELTTAAAETTAFLQSQTAQVSLRSLEVTSGTIQADVLVENKTGHKFPTAYPSRRAWLHFAVRNRNGKVVFESGALNPDGSIQGNANDADPMQYAPHYREINSNDQVEIYESILKDIAGHVTTGLISAVGYFKDNRLLPTGFNKQTADKDISVVGDASDDPEFVAGQDTVHYKIAVNESDGPFKVDVELWYQPIGFRWAHNLEPYSAMETQRFVKFYSSMSSGNAVMIANAEATR